MQAGFIKLGCIHELIHFGIVEFGLCRWGHNSLLREGADRFEVVILTHGGHFHAVLCIAVDFGLNLQACLVTGHYFCSENQAYSILKENFIAL